MHLHDVHLVHRSRSYLDDLYRAAERHRLLRQLDRRRPLRQRLLLTLKTARARLEGDGRASPDRGWRLARGGRQRRSR